MKTISAVAMMALAVSVAFAATPVTYQGNGSLSYYSTSGVGSCGTMVNASTQVFAAAPAKYWTATNPTADSLCKIGSVQIIYNGKTMTVPVKDKCAGCTADTMLLSEAAFKQVAALSVGTLKGVTWTLTY